MTFMFDSFWISWYSVLWLHMSSHFM